MNFTKHIKNLILSAGIVAFQIFQPKTRPAKKVEGDAEEESDVSEEDRLNFQKHAIEYNPATKAILHQYYMLYDEKAGRKFEDEMYVSGIVGKRIPLNSIRRKYITGAPRVKKIK